MAYTVAEFKRYTRRILNEAKVAPVTITRYDETYVLTAVPRPVDPPLPTTTHDKEDA